MLPSARTSASSRWWLPTGASPASAVAAAMMSSAAGVRDRRRHVHDRAQARSAAAAEMGEHDLADRLQVGPAAHQHLGGDPLALADQPEQDVLGPDVVVAEGERLSQRQLEHLLRPRRERDVPARRMPPVADELADRGPHAFDGDPERRERLGGHVAGLGQQPEQQVLGADVVVPEIAGLLLGQDHGPAGPVGEAFEHASMVPTLSMPYY